MFMIRTICQFPIFWLFIIFLLFFCFLPSTVKIDFQPSRLSLHIVLQHVLQRIFMSCKHSTRVSSVYAYTCGLDPAWDLWADRQYVRDVDDYWWRQRTLLSDRQTGENLLPVQLLLLLELTMMMMMMIIYLRQTNGVNDENCFIGCVCLFVRVQRGYTPMSTKQLKL